MPRRLGGWGDCHCCPRCTNCCSGSSPYAWYVDTTGATDATCTFCNEAVAAVFFVTAVDGDAERCEWDGTFGDTAYWTYSDACVGSGTSDGFEFTWRLRFFVMRFHLTIACVDDDTYGITATITQEWTSDDDSDPVDCCGGFGTSGMRRAVSHYYAEHSRGDGECAEWSSVSLSLDSTDYEYWDTGTSAWVPMTPSTYSPCTFPSTITITAV